MPMINPILADGFSVSELTAAINVVPNQFGRIQRLGIYPEKGVTTTTVIVESQDGVLNLLPTTPRGGPATVGQAGKRKVRSFVIPQVAHEDTVMPEEVQNVRAFGSETEMDVISAVVNEKLMTMSRKHDITREYHMVKGLQGIVVDADGSTVLADYFDAFGISRQSFELDLTAGTPPVREIVADILRYYELNLKGDVMTRPRVFCSEGFWDAFISHSDVKDSWDRWMDGEWKRQDPRAAFTLWGIEWEEYIGQASDAAGNNRLFIPANEAFAIPMGTMSTFQMVYAPADFNETANTRGLRMYAKQDERKFGRGIDIHTQSNPLPLCFRPQLLVKLTKV